MSNKEIIAKIKAEIERLKEKAERRPHATPLEGFECMGKIKVCNELISFLSTLESEKQMQEGLEEENTDVDVLDKEFYRYLKIHGLSIQKGERITYYNGDTPNLLFDLKSIVCHFYNFGCFRTAEKYNEIEHNRQRAEESVPKDLEEAEKPIEQDELEEELDFQTFAKEMEAEFAILKPFNWEYKIARHFAEWGAEHLKK